MPITVTVLDTGGIQPFIFGSNVLRENIGASELVHRATRLWAFEALDALDILHNIDKEAASEDCVGDMYTDRFKVDDSNTEGAEVLYAGGGNTVILFQGAKPVETARAFVYQLSRRLLRDAPGLNLYAAHLDYTWGGSDSLPETIEKALKQLGGNKGRDPGSLPALGFPVTAACTSTGLPANDRHPDTQGKTGSANRANRQVRKKWITADWAKMRLTEIFPRVEEARFEWIDDFDRLAALPKRDDSYIAVVHADGNGMGARIKALTTYWSSRSNDPRGYIKAMQTLSNAVQQTAQTALEQTLNAMVDYLATNDWLDPRQHGYDKETDKHYFPVRPIVFGGDDVTLVCVGPWGLAVAQRYLWELEQLSLPVDCDNDLSELPPHPYSCAGVAIVKTHYPFSQAYGLSEDLIKVAKMRSKDLADKKASAIDWHMTTTGLHGDLETIREREYKVDAGNLTMRPLVLDEKLSWRNWTNLSSLLDVFGEGGDWEEQRNKTMRLREALRGGQERVAEFWTIFGKKSQTMPTVPLDKGAMQKDGWVEESGGKRCLYFDPIEIAGQFFELPEKKEGA